MQLWIGPTRLVSEVQKDFNAVFPYLKIEFFQKSAIGKIDTRLAQLISPESRRISDCQTAVTDGHFEIREEMKVSEFEKILKEQFKLNARILRQSGTLWLQVTMTDNWTLQKQNEHGREISSPENGPVILPEEKKIQ